MLTVLCLQLCLSVVFAKYQPTWPSLDSRPLPTWYDESKFGIFCHWGAYSVPAYKESAWLWWYWKGNKPDKDVINYIERNYKPDTTYADFARDFTAELFDPKEFADIVKSSGAKYFVLTSKHHEGFTLWPTRTSWNWNSVDIGPKRDIIGELKDAFKGTDIHYGLYFSQFEFFHPMYLDDKKYNTTAYVEQVSYPQLLELVNRYKPEVVWSDGDWEKSDEYWRSKEFLAWLYNTSPIKDNVVVNDRWGQGSIGKHGGFLTFSDHFDPDKTKTIDKSGHICRRTYLMGGLICRIPGGASVHFHRFSLSKSGLFCKLVQRKWENCMTLDKLAWGSRRTMKSSDVHTVHELIEQLARTVSCGGNLLLNVGPDMHGKIPPIFEDRLRELGRFLNANSEALYGTKPWIHQNDSGNTWYTSRILSSADLAKNRSYNPQIEWQTIVYAWVLDMPTKDLELKNVKTTSRTKVTFLGTDISFEPGAGPTLLIRFNSIPWRQLVRNDVMILKIENAATQKESNKEHERSKVRRFLDYSWAYDAF